MSVGDALLGLLLATGASLLLLATSFHLIERSIPARADQPFFRRGFRTDLAFFLGQYLVFNGAVLWLVGHVGAGVDSIVPQGFRAAVAAQPWWLQAIEAIVLSDLVIYWGHRLQHRIGFLWRFHSIHHSAEHLDWLAAHREHPLDTVYTVTLVNLPPVLLGFPMETLAGLVIFRGVWAIVIHSNARLGLGPLRLLIGSPELHHWHHDRDRDAGNYANLSPLMDVIFGTYRHPDREPAAFGVREPMPSTYLGQLLHPFRRPRRE